MITALMARDLPPATEGASSRLVAIADHLRARFDVAATDFDAEDVTARLSRRQRNWIPQVEVRVAEQAA